MLPGMLRIVSTQADSVRPVPRTSETGSWQEAMRSAVRDPVRLCRLLGLPEQYHSGARRAAELFPVFAPTGYVARMRPGDPRDPLLRQVLPLAEELNHAPEFRSDPVDDEAAEIMPGVLKKYNARALLVTTGACAVHCRYCFRRHYPYSAAPRGAQAWRPAVARIAADPSIHEVILSGGDPLTLVDEQLARLTQMLAEVSHVKRLRIHTRLPIMIPQRVNPSLLAWLTGSRLTPLVVVHANHPLELDASVGDALGRLLDAGVPLLNQAVLLRGVNDDEGTLASLCERLVDLRVMPYYLHQLDRVSGAAHFEVPVVRGRELIRRLQARLPGYAVPRYVQEIAGESSKVPLA